MWLLAWEWLSGVFTGWAILAAAWHRLCRIGHWVASWGQRWLVPVTLTLIVLTLFYGLTQGRVGWRVKVATLAVVGLAWALTWIRSATSFVNRFAKPS